ncbi:class II aldolase/adducin family protein [Myxococcota bacterium]|nr:class II aldolase/adducin family protein [Myxococcota bacterium]
MSVHQLRKQIAAYSTLLHDKGHVANHDGNVSARTADGDRFLITPTATSKRLCAPDTIVECDRDGKPVSRGKPPSEVALHVGAYRARPDAKAVIHAHPPHASAFALAQVELAPIHMPEVVVSLGDRVPLVRMLLPKDPETEAAVGDALTIADVVLLAGNGVLAIGDDLEQAWLRVELVEHYARILTISKSVGAPATLDAGARERLLDMRAKAGLGPKARGIAPKGAVKSSDAKVDPKSDAKKADAPAHKVAPPVAAAVRTVVAEEVRRALGVEK